MGNIIVGALLLVVIALVVRSLYKSKKAGYSIQCGMNCKKCKGQCCHDK